MRFLSSTLKLFALSLFLLAFACSSLLAQGWYQTYPELYPSSEITTNGQQVSMFEGIIQTKDNGFLTWGSHIQNGVPTSNRAFRFTKTDLTGNVQWTQLYEEGVSPAFDGLTGFTMTALPNGNGYLGMGKTTNQTVSTFRGIQLDDQANVVNSFELSEFDLVGATITFGPTTTTKMIDIVPSPDGTFVAMFSNYAPYFAATADENYSWLAKINLDGSIVWTSMIANTIAVPSFGIEAGQTTLMMSGLDVSPSGEIYASGISSVPIITTYQVLFKYDINGNELWFQKRETPNSSSEFTDVLAHPTGDVIVRGHELGWSSVMARLSSAGDTIWADTNAIYFYTENSTEYIPIDFCVLKDGNIGVLEMQTDNVDSQDQNLRFVIKDIYNNYLSTGNPFLSSLYSYHVGNGINSGKSPNDFDLIATNDNSMALAGQYFYSDVADPSITPFTYDVAYPYLAKQGPGGEIPTVSLSGHLFIDSNNNCTFDVGEEGVAYKLFPLNTLQH